VPTEPLRIRLQAWLQERLPLTQLNELGTHKTVPLHNHYIWYYLGGILLLALTLSIVTGFLLIVYYQPAVTDDMELPGAHESVRQIVNDLPHGWWVRSIHHWSAHLMIMAAFIHMFRVLLLKAYRRPRELLWWTGLGLMGIILFQGFTGYLLPWNGLSFAATRVGGGIAAATPFAGPLIRNLLMAGPDINAATVTRFFGLHVAILPLAMLSLVGAHLCLMAYHGSSIPPSIPKDDQTKGNVTPILKFWPEFAFRDLRVWLIVFVGVLIVAFLFPPVLGERADPLAPAPEGIKPEWYFLAMFKAIKLIPDHVLGLENLQISVVGFGTIGLVMVIMPLVFVVPGQTASQRRWLAIKRRVLLLACLGIGWAAMTPPIRMVCLEHWPGWWDIRTDTAALITPLIVGLGWLIIVIVIDRAYERSPNGPASLFGWALVSACIGYTFWEAIGVKAALAGLGIFWVCLLVIWLARSRIAGMAAKPAILASIVLLLAVMLGTIPLGIGHEGLSIDDNHTESDSNTPTTQPVLPENRAETASRFYAILLVSGFLLVVIQRRISQQSKLRDMGLMK
jgi:cytochrome b6